MGDHGIVCERARAWAALQPDGELSSFEQRLLDAHLERCEPCSGFAARVASTTQAIRLAPAEAPAHPVSVSRAARFAPRRLAPRRAAYSAAAAAAAAVVALTISSGVSVSVPGPATVTSAPLIVVTDGDDSSYYRSLRELRRLQLAGDGASPAVRKPYHFGARSA